jgi:hypothetical protein
MAPIRRGLRQPARHAHPCPTGGIPQGRAELGLHRYRKSIDLHKY